MPSRRRARTKNLGTNLADVQRRMRYLERRPVRTKLQKKVVTAVNIVPESITADEVSFGTAVITTETDVGNVVVDNPKDGLLIVSSTNGSSSVYSDTDAAFIPITDTAAQATADTALEESEAAAAAAIAAEAEAAAAAADAAAAEVSAQASFDEAAASAEAAAAAEVAAQASFDEAAASAAAADAAETAAATSAADAAAAEIAAQEAFDQATASATAANDAEIAAQEAADAATGSAGDALTAAEQAQEAADQAIASAAAAQEAFDEAQAAAQAAADADAAAVISAEESAAAAAAAEAAQEAADAAALDAADATLAAESSATDAEAAAASALAATTSANKKNSVFRAPASAYTAPTYNPAGQPLANSIGDIWFDTTPLTSDITKTGSAAGGSKPKRWNGTIWEPFGLSYAAITSIDAETITTGTLIGRTVKTSDTGNRVELSNSDVISFYNEAGVTVGSIQPGFLNEGLILTAGSGGSTITMTGSGWGDDSAIVLSTSGNSGSITMSDGSFTDPDTGEITDTGGIIITGNDLTIQGSNGWTIKDSSSDAVIYGQGGDMYVQGGGVSVNLSGGDIELQGNLVLGVGTYVQGTGAPTAAATDGTIIFKYT